MFATKTLISVLLVASGLVTATNSEPAPPADAVVQAPLADAVTPQNPPVADPAACQLIATQTGDHVGDALKGTVNYAIGRTIGMHWGAGRKIRGRSEERRVGKECRN